MPPVKWDEVARDVYEDIVSVLLSTLNPGAQRIDGAGGDDGRDVQIITETELHIFECKSFTGRLGAEKGRRSQVERSLKAAMLHQPDSWTLIVPINRTPAEEEWFSKLPEKLGITCPIKWLDKDWLDKQMIENERIRRYFIDGVNDEVVQLLRELNQEGASFGSDINTALTRVQNIVRRLNDIDPYYRIDISVTGNQTAVAYVPRWKGADQERPISLSVSFEFPDTEIGRIEATKFSEAVRRGDAITVSDSYVRIKSATGPVGITQLTGTSANVQISSTRKSIPGGLPGRLVVTSPEGRRLAILPVRFHERKVGTSVATIYAADKTDSVSVSAEFDPSRSRGDLVTAQISISYNPRDDMYPSELLPVLQFGHHMCSPNMVQLELGDAGVVGDTAPLDNPTPVPAAFIRQVERLARIQASSNTPFPAPIAFTREQVHEIDLATKLLDGGSLTVAGEVLFNAKVEILEDDTQHIQIMDESLLDSQLQVMLSVYEPITVCGEQVYLGQGAYFCANVSVVNSEEARRVLRGELETNDFHLVLAPADDVPVKYRLLGPSDPDELNVTGAVVIDLAQSE
ncbi:hypothetical protein [Nocardia farcinica]|uniref:hypothetical protein n=1 Tax=Nocardia farcinica TaxID=37329 RepID=UPI0024582C75|nr:hypothetical protein [Nocardia farcinica]